MVLKLRYMINFLMEPLYMHGSTKRSHLMHVIAIWQAKLTAILRMMIEVIAAKLLAIHGFPLLVDQLKGSRPNKSWERRWFSVPF